MKLLFLIFVMGCSQSVPCYYGAFANVTFYPFRQVLQTPSGIRVDTNESLDIQTLDEVIARIETCLAHQFPDGTLPQELFEKARCYRGVFIPRINRDCLRVQIAPDYYRSKCSDQLEFACSINPQLCRDKGLTPTVECPCACRGAIADNQTIVTTPDMLLLTSDIVRLVTTCNFPWGTSLEECI